MESVFEKLEKAQDGKDRSDSWWRQASKVAMRSALADGTKESVITNERRNLDDKNKVLFTPRTGTLVLFEYDAATTKQKVPYYDQLPMVLVLRVNQDHFFGANLHYISPKKRLKTIEALLKNKIDVPRQIIHKYKKSDVKNGSLFIEIDENDWDSAIYLPLEQFVSAVGKIEIPVASKKVWFKYDPLAKYRFKAKRKIQ